MVAGPGGTAVGEKEVGGDTEVVTGEEVVGGNGGTVVGGCDADEETGRDEVGTYAVVG